MTEHDARKDPNTYRRLWTEGGDGSDYYAPSLDLATLPDGSEVFRFSVGGRVSMATIRRVIDALWPANVPEMEYAVLDDILGALRSLLTDKNYGTIGAALIVLFNNAIKRPWLALDPANLPQSRVLVTNNLDAVDRYGIMSHVWIVRPMLSSDQDKYPNEVIGCADDGDRLIRQLSHYMPLPTGLGLSQIEGAMSSGQIAKLNAFLHGLYEALIGPTDGDVFMTMEDAYDVLLGRARQLRAPGGGPGDIVIVDPQSESGQREAQTRVDVAASQLLMLAFLVPEGTDLRTHPMAKAITEYKAALEARAAV